MPLQPGSVPEPLPLRYVTWRATTRVDLVPTQHAVRADDEDGWAPVLAPPPRVVPPCSWPHRPPGPRDRRHPGRTRRRGHDA